MIKLAHTEYFIHIFFDDKAVKIANPLLHFFNHLKVSEINANKRHGYG